MYEIIGFIIDGILDCFEQLEEFQFLGTNMLKFSLTIMIAGILVPILFTIAKGTSYKLGRVERNTRK